MKIRTAKVSDAESIAYVGIKTWQTAYRGIFPDHELDNMSMKENTEKWKKIITSNSKNENLEMIVAEDSKAAIVGYAGGGRYDTTPPYDCEIGAIYVLKEYQGRGIGSQLTQWMFNFFLSKDWKTMIIWVLEENPYRRFYDKTGGVEKEKKPYEKWDIKKKIVSYVWDDISKIKLDV